MHQAKGTINGGGGDKILEHPRGLPGTLGGGPQVVLRVYSVEWKRPKLGLAGTGQYSYTVA